MTAINTDSLEIVARNYSSNKTTFEVEILSKTAATASLFRITQKGIELKPINKESIHFPFSNSLLISFHQTDNQLLRMDVSKTDCLLISCKNDYDRFLIYKTFQMFEFYNFQEFHFGKSFSVKGSILGKTLEIESISQRCLSEKTVSFEIRVISGINYLPSKIAKHTPTILKILSNSIQIASNDIILATYTSDSILQLDYDLVHQKTFKLKTKNSQIIFECSNKYLSELLYQCFKNFQAPPLRQTKKDPESISVSTLQKSNKTFTNIKRLIKSSEQRTHLLRHTLNEIQSTISNSDDKGNLNLASSEEEMEMKNLNKNQKKNEEIEIDNFQNKKDENMSPSKNAFEIAIQRKTIITMKSYVEISKTSLILFLPNHGLNFQKQSKKSFNYKQNLQEWETISFPLNLNLSILKKNKKRNTLTFEIILTSDLKNNFSNFNLFYENLNENEYDNDNPQSSSTYSDIKTKNNDNTNENTFKIDKDFRLNSNYFIQEKYNRITHYVYNIPKKDHVESIKFSILFLNLKDMKNFIRRYNKNKLKFNRNILQKCNLKGISDKLFLQIPKTLIRKLLPKTKFVFNSWHLSTRMKKIVLICNNNWLTILFENGIRVYPMKNCLIRKNPKYSSRMGLEIYVNDKNGINRSGNNDMVEYKGGDSKKRANESDSDRENANEDDMKNGNGNGNGKKKKKKNDKNKKNKKNMKKKERKRNTKKRESTKAGNILYTIEFSDLTNATLFQNIIEKASKLKTDKFEIKPKTKPLVINKFNNNNGSQDANIDDDTHYNKINYNSFGKFLNCYSVKIIQRSSKSIGLILLTTKAILLVIGNKFFFFNIRRDFYMCLDSIELNNIQLSPFANNIYFSSYQIIFTTQIEKLLFVLDCLKIKQSLFPEIQLKNFQKNLAFFTDFRNHHQNYTQKQLNKIQNKAKKILKKEYNLNLKVIKELQSQNVNKNKKKSKKPTKKKQDISINIENNNSGSESHKELLKSESLPHSDLSNNKSHSLSEPESQSQTESNPNSNDQSQSQNTEKSDSGNSESEKEDNKSTSGSGKSSTQSDSEPEPETQSQTESNPKSNDQSQSQNNEKSDSEKSESEKQDNKATSDSEKLNTQSESEPEPESQSQTESNPKSNDQYQSQNNEKSDSENSESD
ncbi:transcriptional regulator atrx [Anaeramoeba flamelloides]|uniref:Transcriptional regulator atrx n=1 Tax=Anaeramoeba flamelloides TaxID=1746091 RepID=A0ABQ8XKI2_9EUKA|nr:transcriptional regulator atrx [Anaeramoeba flamelloides]